MARGRILQNVFNNGEVTPRLSRRVDFDKYRNSVATLTNFHPFIQGGVTRRPGTRWVKETKTSNTESYLVPFVFNSDQSYMCEFGNFYVRFYALSVRLEVSGNPVEVSTPYSFDELPNLHYAQSGDVLYLTHPNHPIKRLIRTSAITFVLNDANIRGGPFLDENVDDDAIIVINRNTSPWRLEAIGHTPFTQQHIDSLWGVNIGNGYGVFEITAVPSTSAASVIMKETVGEFLAIDQANNEYPINNAIDPNIYLSQSIQIFDEFTPFSLELSLRRNGTLIPNAFVQLEIREFSVADEQPFSNVIARSDVVPSATLNTTPQWVRFLFDPVPVLRSGFKYAILLSANHPASDTDNIMWEGNTDDIYRYGKAQKFIPGVGWSDVTGVSDFLIRNISSNRWKEGAWSGVRGYPHTVNTYEQRLWFAATNTQPQTFWGSTLNDFENFHPDTDGEITARDAVTFTVAGTQDQIIWLAGIEDLMIATKAGPYYIQGGDNSGISAVNPPNIKRVSYTKVDEGNPVIAGKRILYIGGSGGKVYEIAYNPQVDGLDSIDRSILVPHMKGYKRGLSAIAYASDPDPIVYIVRPDGDLTVISYLPEQDVVGFARYSTQGEFEAVATIPHEDGDSDQVWVIVKRIINGVARRYIEYFDIKNGQFPFNTQVGLDCVVSYDGIADDSLNIATHLAGEMVGVIGDGSVLHDHLASAGTVFLSEPVTKAEIGLNFESTLVELEPVIADGQFLGLPLSYVDISIHVLDTIGLTVDGRPVSFRDIGSLMGVSVEPFSGEKKTTITGWESGKALVIQQTQPLPCTILSSTRTVATGDV